MSTIHLPPAERDVLACLHRQGQATARQIREGMQDYRPMSHGSVVTLLGRLEAKALVTKEKGPVGKAFVYRACQAPESAFGHLVRDLLQRVFHGDPLPLVASLFEARPPTALQVEQLQQMLGQMRRKEGAKKEKRP
jgi:BlaI family transcriptional regulator, penicillinase repressor